MVKLKLGYSTSMPIKSSIDVPEYSVENINLIKTLSKRFSSIQIMFTKSKLTPEEISQIKLTISNYKYICVHASYQINIGADLIPSQTDLYNVGLDILINEIILAKKIKAFGIVLHMGKNVKKKYENSHVYNNMIKFVVELFRRLNKLKLKIKILLETPAGQGGEMCWNLDEFVEFICRFSNQKFYPMLGVCLDTCHMFQAGLDLNNDKIIKQAHQTLLPIKDKINLIHLNDSYHPVGQHIDRHEQIGKGHICVDKLVKFICVYKNVPMILETDGFSESHKKGPYENQLKLIESEQI